MALPEFDSEWFQLGPAAKIARFTAAGTTLDELRSIADEGTIQWMMTEGGWKPPAQYQPEPVYVEPEPVYYEPEPWWVTQQREEEQRIALEQEYARQARVNEILSIQSLSAEQKGRFYLDQLARGYSDASLRQEVESILGYQSAWPELQQIARNLQQQDQQVEAARQEAIRLEAARVEAARQEAARQEAARLEAERIEAERIEAARQEAARQEAARIAAEQQTTRDKAASVGVNLPSNWFDFSAEDKAKWLTGAKVTEGQISQIAGASGLEALKQYGYYDVPAKLAAEQEAARVAEAARQEAAKQEAARVEAAKRTAAENEVKNLYQEVLGRQPTASELENYVTKFGTSIDATEKNTFSEDVSTEVLKNKLLAGNPDGDELTRRVVIEAVNNKWTPEQTLNFVNTQFGVNKTMADYERAVSDFFAPAVSNLLANGATETEIRKLGEDQGIIPSVIDAAVKNNIGQIEKNDLANAVKNFYTTEKRTEDGVEKTYISPDFAKLIDYATTNKLSYADVAAAFSSGRPEFGSINITKDLVYEKDRQQFNALVKEVDDPANPGKKIKSVSYGDALKAAITQGIGLENLAKFFGQEPDKFKTNISSNLPSFADSLRASGVNPEAGLSDLLGIKPADTTAALKTFDTDKAITGSLKQKEAGGLTYNEILDEIEASGMNIDDFVNRYFGQNKTDLVTGLKSESKFTPEQRDLRDDYNAFASEFNKDNPLTYAKISDYLANKQLTDAQASSLFGISADDLAGYRTDTRLTNRLNEEKADDGKLSLSEILGVIDGSGMDINTFVEKYFGKDQSALATSLAAEKKFTPEQRALRETYNDYIAGFGDKKPTLADVASFVDQNKLTDAQAESVLGVPAKDLGAYRRDTFITSGLNALEQSDNRLDYTEIVTFVKDNNIPFSEVAKYLATPEKQDSFVKTLEDTQTDMGRSPSERLAFQLNELTNSGKQSGKWDRNEGWDHHAEKMTNYLTNLGVTDLRNIATKIENRETQDAYEVGSGDDIRTEYRTVSTPHVVYYDKATGKELQAVDQRNNNGSWEFGSEGSGKGSTGYILAPTSKTGEGGVGVTSQWREKYGVQEYAMPLAFIAAVAAPYLLPELIGGVVGGVELAALGGEAIAGTGLTGSLMSAGIPASVAPYAAQIIVNGVYNGTLSEATGGDFTKGFVTGGLAPVMGQITSNAVNSALADLNLPSGVDRAVGNAVTQLIAKGEIDPLQMLTVGVSPTISKALQDATGLNSAQTKLVLDTVLSQGKNLQALMNPQTALNFVMQNKGVFDGLGLDAASGATNIQTGQAVDLGAFNEDQVRVLQGQDTVSAIGTDTLPGAGIDTVIGAGQDTVSPAVEDIISGATGLDTAPSITTPGVIDEFQGYDSAIRAAEAIASGATQFEGVEAVQRFLEARAAGALDYQGYDMARLEATLIGSQKTYANALAAAKTLYGPNATFNYGGELFSTKTGLPAGASAVEVPGSSEVPMARLPNGIFSHQGFLAAGGGKDPEDYRSYVIAANELINKTGSAEAIKPSVYNVAAARASDTEKTPANTGIWEAAKTWVQNQLKLSSQEAEKYLKDNPNSPFTQSVSEAREAAGELIKNVVGGTALMFDNKPLAKAFIEGGEDLIRSGQAIGTGPQDTKNFSDTIELMRAAPSVADKVGIMFGRMFDGTSGFSRQTMIELRQEWPAFFLGGMGVKTAMIASGVIDTFDTAGNAAIEAYDGAIKQGKTDAEALTVARQAGLAAGGTEAAVQLTLGKLADFGVNKLDNVFAKAGARTGAEYLTEGAQEGLGSAATDYVVKGAVDLNEAITKGLIGAQIGGQLSGATSPLAISQDMANRPIVSVDAQVISVDPQNQLALVQTQGGAELIDTSNLGDVKQGQSLQVSIPSPVTPINIGEPEIAFTEIPVNGTNSTLVTLSPSQYLPDEDRVIALVDIGNGTTQPFYISTGLGGKVETEPGKWYPFFGIGSDGWFNKTTGKDQANYYNSSLLRDIAQTLDATIGDVRVQSRTYPVIKVSDTGPISFINKDMSPLSYTGAELDAQTFYGNIANNLIRLENSAAGLEASLIKAIEDGTIQDVKQIQTKLDSLNIPADTKASLLTTGSQLLGGDQVQDAASDLNAGAVVPSSGQPVATEVAGEITGGPTVITGGTSVTFDSGTATGTPTIITDASQTAGGPAVTTGGTGVTAGGTGVTTGGPAVTTGGPAITTGDATVTTGGTIATDAAQAAVNAANTANANAQATADTANVLAGTGAVNTSVVNNAAQQASTAATNATQNATTATQAAATGDTTAAVNASNNAVQNANVTQSVTTDLASTFKPKEEFEEPKPVVTTTDPTVTPPATVTPTPTETPPPTVTPPVTPTETPPPTVEPPAVGPTPTTPTTSPTSPTSPATSVKPPGPAFPSLFFPIRVGQDGTQYIDYGYPDVPPPQLPPYTPFGAPNYLRPLDPYLGYGLGALMGGLYAQEPGNGGNQPLQNAQAQTAPAPR